jgi:archaellum component FlaC
MELQMALTAREAELNQLRASAERMGVLLQQKLDAAVAEAESNWKREEAARLDVEKSRLEEQFAHRLADREMRVQAIGDIAREQQASALRLMREEFAATKEALAMREGELAGSRSQLERLRKETEAELRSAHAATESKAAEALTAAEAGGRTNRTLAEMTARCEAAERELASARSAILAANNARPDQEAELNRLRAELERHRKEAEMEIMAMKSVTEAKAAEAMKAAEVAARTSANLTEMTARYDAAEAALASARTAASAANNSRSDQGAELNRLRGELDSQRRHWESEISAMQSVAEAKAAEASKTAEATARISVSLAEMTVRCEAAETALASAGAPVSVAAPIVDRSAEVGQLRAELDRQQRQSESDIASVKASVEAKAADALKAAEGAWTIRAGKALAEVTARCEAAETALAVANAMPPAPDREAELDDLRAELTQQRQSAEIDAVAARGAAEINLSEKLRTSQARWEKETANALAEAVARSETAEAALRTARRVAASRNNDDEYVHGLEREIKTLRATLVDREAAIVQSQAQQEHVRLGTVREAPGRRWQPLSNRGSDAHRDEAEAKSNNRLFRDVAVVVVAAAAAVLLFPRLEALLPDTLRWQIETVGGLFAPEATAPATLSPAPAASVTAKAEHPRMYVTRAVNVRAEPATTAAIATSLKRGAAVAILEKRGNWTRVEVSGSQNLSGWVFNSYLAESDPGTAAVAAAAPVAAMPAAPEPVTSAATVTEPAKPEPAPAAQEAAPAPSEATPATP